MRKPVFNEFDCLAKRRIATNVVAMGPVSKKEDRKPTISPVNKIAAGRVNAAALGCGNRAVLKNGLLWPILAVEPVYIVLLLVPAGHKAYQIVAPLCVGVGVGDAFLDIAPDRGPYHPLGHIKTEIVQLRPGVDRAILAHDQKERHLFLER